MKENAATLQELVEVLDDGRKFYAEAASQARDDSLKRLFARMARTKGAIAEALTSRIAARGLAAPADGTLAGMLRKAYGEIRACLSSSPDTAFVDQLEGFEDRIIRVFRAAASESDDPEVRSVASKYLPDVMRDHSEMSALKRQLGKH